MWINDLKARFSKSSERKIEEVVAPVEPQEPQVEEPEPMPVVILTDPSEVKVPSVWQGIGLEQAIYEANLAGSLAAKEFDKVVVQTTTTTFTCVCGMTFNYREMYDEHRYYSHNTQNHEVEIVRQNTERRDALLNRRGYRQ